MNLYFFDTSAIVKRYVNERGSPWVVGIADAPDSIIYLARITAVEVVSAITRQMRQGNIIASDAMAAIAQFRYDFAAEYRIIEIAPALINRAMIMAETHGLRGYDAVQLAAAIEVNTNTLFLGMPVATIISSDVDLNAAAVVEGLAVDDPNTHP